MKTEQGLEGIEEELSREPLEKLLYLEGILNKALAEAKFKEPLKVFQLAVLKTELLKDIIPLGELLKLAKQGVRVSQVPQKVTEKTEPPKVEGKPEPPKVSEKRETPGVKGEVEKPEGEAPKIQSKKVEAVKEPSKVGEKATKPSLPKQKFVNKLIKDGIVEKPLISFVVKHMEETEEGLLLRIPERVYETFKGEFEKLERYYGKYFKLEIEREVKETEKKFKRLKNTPYLF